jgi:hypothetical protein
MALTTVSLAVLVMFARCQGDDLGVLGAATSWPRDEDAARKCESEGIVAGNAGNANEARNLFFCAMVRWPLKSAGGKQL